MRFRPMGRAVVRELFTRKHDGRVDTGTVGFDPVFAAIGGAIHRHNHAAVREASVVLMHIVWLQRAVVAVLVTIKRAAYLGGFEDGFDSGRDDDSPKWKERGGVEGWMAHGGCSGEAHPGIGTGFMLTTIRPLRLCS